MNEKDREKFRAARIRGERTRALENIRARTELPKQQWWMSFAGEEGFRGVVVAHANDFSEALMDCNLHNCNPGGEVKGMPISPEIVIPSEWTYRIMTKAEATALELRIAPIRNITMECRCGFSGSVLSVAQAADLVTGHGCPLDVPGSIVYRCVCGAKRPSGPFVWRDMRVSAAQAALLDFNWFQEHRGCHSTKPN